MHLIEQRNKEAGRQQQSTTASRSFYVVLLLFSNVLVAHLTCIMTINMMAAREPSADKKDYSMPLLVKNIGATWNLLDPLEIPPGTIPNLPSIRTSEDSLNKARKFYGGAGDKKHLGGFTKIDHGGISPRIWQNMLKVYGVRSFLDVGCGRGTSTLWFLEHGADVLCVEGSHDAVQNSLLPSRVIVEHDYARGPWWPEKTYDAAWAVEFLEHVSRQYHFHYMSTFRKAALIFVTSAKVGGWHHMEVHPDSWWIRKFELYGFKYEPELTAEVRQWGVNETTEKVLNVLSGKPYHAQHLKYSMKVFSNPSVAALPQHQHLFPRDGCFLKINKNRKTEFHYTRPCGTGSKDAHLETPLPAHFTPLQTTPEMHQRWQSKVAAGLNVSKQR